jgi:hypothetical protein
MPTPSETIPETSVQETKIIPDTGSSEFSSVLSSLTKYFNTQIRTITDQQVDISREFHRQEERVRAVEGKLDDSKTQLIETLGLFVALFTFISVEFSLFKEIKVFSAVISLTLVVAGLLLFFVMLLHLMLKLEKNWTSLLVYMLLTIVMGGLIYYGINFNNLYLKGDYRINIPIPTASPSAIVVPTFNN